MTLNKAKNTVLRARIAARLVELRSWPPLNSAIKPNGLRRPIVKNEVATVFSPISLGSLIEQGALELEHLQESEMLAEGEGAEFATQVFQARPLNLYDILVTPKVLEDGAGDRDDVLWLYRSAPATDAQYDAFLETAWKQYQRESQSSDDTDAQYLEFLRLKKIYEPEDGLVS